uniref:Uncharacterized protein n=1 Tax=Erpetoichthys calabaricus TaxID=27687 RepID=A0A8C4RWD4_ERPCA
MCCFQTIIVQLKFPSPLSSFLLIAADTVTTVGIMLPEKHQDNVSQPSVVCGDILGKYVK